MWATKSALTSGMHHCFFCHGLRVFFQMQAHRLVGKGRNQTQLHCLARQRTQRPVVMAPGSRGEGQSDEMGPGPVVQLPVPVGLGPVLQHTVQSVLGETPLDAEHAGLGHIQGLSHLGGGPPLVGLEQYAGSGRNTGRTSASPDQVLQLLPLLRGKPDWELLSNHTTTSQQQHLPASIIFVERLWRTVK